MASSVTLTFPDGQTASIPALWLRDNCPCERCRVSVTTEHRTLVSDSPIELAPQKITVTSRGTTVDWGNHTSEYTLAWFEDVQRQTQRAMPSPKSWHQGFEPPRFSYDALLGDLAVELAFLDAFGEYGAAIVTGTPSIPGFVEAFVSRWAPPYEVPFDRVHDVYVDPAGYNVAHTAEALPPHNDMASRAQPPSGQILHMLVNESVGGESILVDGFAIASALAAGDREVLSSVPAGFRQFSDTSETWTRTPLLRLDRIGNPIHLRYSNQLLQAMDPLDPDTAAWYEAYHRLSAALNERSNQTRFRLNSGDLLMVHGHRVLHGRTEFNPGTGVRHLQDIYFEYDDVMNEAYRLRANPAVRRKAATPNQ